MAGKNTYVATYNANSNATLYIIAFIDNTSVYTVEVPHIRNAWTVWGKTKNNKRKLRLHISQKIREELKRMNTCTYIGEASEIFANCSNTGMNNRGWRTEQIVCATLGIPWEHRKDEGSWDNDCDITVGNTRIQVKFQNASIASASSIEAYL